MAHDDHKDGEAEEQGNVSRLCHCGRGPRRAGQRNCHQCHAEANRRYRASLKKQAEALRRMAAAKKG